MLWVLVFMIGFLAGMVVMEWIRLRIDGLTTPKRPKCSERCHAPAWDECIDRRCRYHCGELCKCLPVGKPGSLKSIPGGRGA